MHIKHVFYKNKVKEKYTVKFWLTKPFFILYMVVIVKENVYKELGLVQYSWVV